MSDFSTVRVTVRRELVERAQALGLNVGQVMSQALEERVAPTRVLAATTVVSDDDDDGLVVAVDRHGYPIGLL